MTEMEERTLAGSGPLMVLRMQNEKTLHGNSPSQMQSNAPLLMPHHGTGINSV